jgi:glycosyltransferase involved in cell wall biosynthesis
MRIWVYTICYNEQHFVKNFLAAYAEAEMIIAYDNQSTDNTVPLLLEDPRVTIRSWDSGNQIRDDKYLEIKNNCWKEAKGIADWAIVVDFDEIVNRVVLTADNVPYFNMDFRKPYDEGKTIIKPWGYNMVSINAPLGAPGHPFEYSKKGVYHWPMEKPCIFRPDKLQEINFVPGCHSINPVGEAEYYNGPEYKLLHFKMWNFDLYLQKMQMSAVRMSAINREKGWGEHYLWPLERHKKGILEAFAAAKPLMDIRKTDRIYT